MVFLRSIAYEPWARDLTNFIFCISTQPPESLNNIISSLLVGLVPVNSMKQMDVALDKDLQVDFIYTRYL